MDALTESLFEIESQSLYYRTEVMMYFEKHNIFQIIYDLMMMLDRNRPDCIAQYVVDNIFLVAQKYNQVNTVINIADNVGLGSIMTTFKSSCIIAVKTEHQLEALLQKLKRYLKQETLDGRNMIFLGDIDSLEVTQRVFHINLKLSASNSNLSNMEKKITQRTNLLKISPPHPVVQNTQRILILGAPGCGKHRIGRWLSQRLGVCFVSTTDLMEEHARKMNCFGRALSIHSWQNEHTSELLSVIVQCRLLKLECLRCGWILVDFPNTAADVSQLFGLPITPNKVLIINTDESKCLQRKLRRNFQSTCWKNTILQAEMQFYSYNKLSIREALEQQPGVAILQVDGNRSYRNIQKTILTKIINQQCV